MKNFIFISPFRIGKKEVQSKPMMININHISMISSTTEKFTEIIMADSTKILSETSMDSIISAIENLEK